nr:hypothetical protein [Ardenticatena sp.]
MNTVIQANLERCLRSPYLRRDERKRQEIGAELAAAQDLYNQAKTSFEAEDTTTGMKQAWGAMFRAARALVYAAGYDFDGLRCMEVVLEAHYLGKGLEAADFDAFRAAQKLHGAPEEALARASAFIEKVKQVLQTTQTA